MHANSIVVGSKSAGLAVKIDRIPEEGVVGAADKAAILLVKVQPHQLLVLDVKRYHGLGQVTNQEIAWCKRPGCCWGESPDRWVQSGGLASVGA